MILRHNQVDYLRERIAALDRLADAAPTLEARRLHAELAAHYRGELRDALTRQMKRFAGKAVSAPGRDRLTAEPLAQAAPALERRNPLDHSVTKSAGGFRRSRC